MDELTAAEQQALRYQQIVEAYTPGCDCPPCRLIALVISIPIAK